MQALNSHPLFCKSKYWSHRYQRLHVFSKEIFGQVELKKLVKPMRWQNYATTPEFSAVPAEVVREIQRQEFLLNRLHHQLEVRYYKIIFETPNFYLRACCL